MTKADREYRLERLRVMAPWYGRALVALATTLPLGVVTWLLQEFAGQDTNLNVSVVASVSFVANLAMGAAWKTKDTAMKAQSAELNRLRGVADAYGIQGGTLATPRQQGGPR